MDNLIINIKFVSIKIIILKVIERKLILLNKMRRK